MDDADIADTVIVPRRVAAPSRDPREATGDPDESETMLRERPPVDLVTPGQTFDRSPPLMTSPLTSSPPVTTSHGASRRESHAATLAPVPPAEQDVARYRYRINDGPIVDLDEVTLIGRKPSLTRVPSSTRPSLVTVPSPEREVSSTHIELTQFGASIVVTDMKTTNGTRVVMPGAAPVALRPGESVVAVPGSVIDIGDGNLIEILPMRRFVPVSSVDERPPS